MRLFTLIPVTFIPVIFAVTGPAAAQNWQEYSYPDYSFRVSFPAAPQIEQRALEAPVPASQLRAPRSRLTARVLNYAVVASKRSPRW